MRSFGLIFAVTLLARLSSLISFPITARTLSVAELGQLTMWHTVRGLLLLACCLGLPDIIARRIAKEGHLATLVTAVKVSSMVLLMLGCVGEVLLQFGLLTDLVTHPRLLWIAVLFDLLPALFIAALPASGHIRWYATVLVLPALLVATLSAVLVSPPFSMGLVGPLYAHITASIATTLLCVVYVTRMPSSVDARVPSSRELLRESLPILGIALVGMALTTIDRYSINWTLGAEGVGFYAVAFQVAALLSFGGGSVRSSISQKIIRNAQSDLEALSALARRYLCCGAWFAVMLCATAPEIIALLAGNRFSRFAEIVAPLSAAILLLEMFSLGQAIAVAQGMAAAAFRSIVIGSGFAVVAIPALTYFSGILGTSIGLAGSYMVAFAAVMRDRQVSLRPGVQIWVVLALLCGLGWLYAGQDWAAHSETTTVRLLLGALAVAIGLRHLHDMSKDRVS